MSGCSVRSDSNIAVVDGLMWPPWRAIAGDAAFQTDTLEADDLVLPADLVIDDDEDLAAGVDEQVAPSDEKWQDLGLDQLQRQAG